MPNSIAPIKNNHRDRLDKSNEMTNNNREVSNGTTDSNHDDAYDFETFLENFCRFDNDDFADDFRQSNCSPSLVAEGNTTIDDNNGLQSSAIEVKEPKA